MQLLSHIPGAIFHNIGFMAVLYLVYVLIQQITNCTAKHLFIIAVSFQIISTIDFMYFILASHMDILGLQNQFFESHWYSFNTSPFLPYIGVVYFICLLYFMSKLVHPFLQLSTLKNKANFSDSKKWKSLIGGTSIVHQEAIEIGYSHLIKSPVTFGWLDPIILLPFSICNQLSMDQVKTILLHEIAHIIRYDYIIHILVESCHACLHFNPFSYLFLKEISLQRELACDKWVIQQHQDPLVYTQALYTLGLNSIQNTAPHLFLHVVNQQSELMIRIKKMNQLKVTTVTNKSWLRNLAFAFIGTSLLLTSTVMHSPNPSNAQVLVPSTNLINTFAANSISNLNYYRYLYTRFSPYSNFNPYSNRNSISNNSIKDNMSFNLNNKHENKSRSILPTNQQTNKGFILLNPSSENDLAKMHAKMHSPVYAKLVNQTLNWIKAHESVNQFSSYDNNMESEQFIVAEKLLLHTILKNYQLKRALLNDKLNQIQDEKDAEALLKNSKEYQQVLQYENWTKEFLQQHPGSLPIIDSTSQY
jgi:beta-lactamase regulating signal transducer with metallopeptidase domain